MKNLARKVLLPLLVGVLAGTLASCVGGQKGDEYDKDGNLKISMRNLYFEDWNGSDYYTEKVIKEKFKVAITPTGYSYNDWDTQVSGAINGNNLTDVFHFNITQFNYGNTYKTWANGRTIKALPDDMSKWPNLKSMLDNTTSIESLKIDGKLYGIPVAKNIATPEVNYSPFTYLYRRDFAKAYGVYQENDEYTWEQFLTLINTFNEELNIKTAGQKYALADVEWGYPSITNFYKDSPHCFSFDGSKYVSTFATEKYQEGLEIAKDWTNKRIYGHDQYNAQKEGAARKAFLSNMCGILFENLSLSNYKVIRDGMRTSNPSPSFNIDDATAIMKIKGPDGKYALEGTDNWFSMTMFDYEISDEKMFKILDIIDYLLSEEGTKLAVYGVENVDYYMDEGKVVLSEQGWSKDDRGQYVGKVNGAKYLRYLATLGNDYAEYDPLTNEAAFSVLNKWNEDMHKASENGELRVFKEKDEVIWLSLPKKDRNESGLLSNATANVINYCYNKINHEAYLATMNTSLWKDTLKEINDHFGY